MGSSNAEFKANQNQSGFRVHYPILTKYSNKTIWIGQVELGYQFSTHP